MASEAIRIFGPTFFIEGDGYVDIHLGDAAQLNARSDFAQRQAQVVSYVGAKVPRTFFSWHVQDERLVLRVNTSLGRMTPAIIEALEKVFTPYYSGVVNVLMTSQRDGAWRIVFRRISGRAVGEVLERTKLSLDELRITTEPGISREEAEVAAAQLARSLGLFPRFKRLGINPRR